MISNNKMPNKQQYQRQADTRKLKALAEYEKRVKKGESRLCERCIRIEQMRRAKEAVKNEINIEFKDVIIRWD